MNAHRLGPFLKASDETTSAVPAGFMAWPAPLPAPACGSMDLYRIAYEQACAVMRPSLIDRALSVHVN
ncbi:MAG: hypothetical protein U0800_14850 [Isosphaeraceae bacterium]